MLLEAGRAGESGICTCRTLSSPRRPPPYGLLSARPSHWSPGPAGGFQPGPPSAAAAAAADVEELSAAAGARRPLLFI